MARTYPPATHLSTWARSRAEGELFRLGLGRKFDQAAGYGRGPLLRLGRSYTPGSLGAPLSVRVQRCGVSPSSHPGHVGSRGRGVRPDRMAATAPGRPYNARRTRAATTPAAHPADSRLGPTSARLRGWLRPTRRSPPPRRSTHPTPARAYWMHATAPGTFWPAFSKNLAARSDAACDHICLHEGTPGGGTHTCLPATGCAQNTYYVNWSATVDTCPPEGLAWRLPGAGVPKWHTATQLAPHACTFGCGCGCGGPWQALLAHAHPIPTAVSAALQHDPYPTRSVAGSALDPPCARASALGSVPLRGGG